MSENITIGDLVGYHQQFEALKGTVLALVFRGRINTYKKQFYTKNGAKIKFVNQRLLDIATKYTTDGIFKGLGEEDKKISQDSYNKEIQEYLKEPIAIET